MKGVSSVTGSTSPVVNETTYYEVSGFYPGTPPVPDSHIKWKLYAQLSNGTWRELVGQLKTGRRAPFKFPQKWYGTKLMIEAYIHNPERKCPPGIIVTPVQGPPAITKVEILDAEGKPLQGNPHFLDTVTLRVYTANMLGRKVTLSLWEDDTLSDDLVWGKKSIPVNNKNGIAEQKLMLSNAIKNKGGSMLSEGWEQELFLLAEAHGTSGQSPVVNVITEPRQTSTTVTGGARPPRKPQQQESAATVEDNKVEGLTQAYFAKKEYTEETDIAAGEDKYKFDYDNNNINKNEIAEIIKKKMDARFKPDRKYSKLNEIISALTKDSYKAKEEISINLFELGPKFIPIKSAPLDDKVYLVARSYLLEGKEATIIIKEKDGIIKGTADAALPVLELTEAQMEQTEPLKENERIEKAEFTETFKDDIVKIPVQLRPKSDDELAKWKEKIAKGKQEGTHTYTAQKPFTIDSSEQLQQIAKTIAARSNNDPKLKDKGLQVYEQDIIELLRPKRPEKYGEASYSEVKPIPTYKKASEMLWLEVACDGDLACYQEKFLKQDGEYFVIGKKCFCKRGISESELKQIIRRLRKIENISSEELWNPVYPSGISPSDKSYASTAMLINQIMRKYNIDSCIRKIHFLAQTYHETDRFRSMTEYDSMYTPGYDPYRGRGLVHLTHGPTYKKFSIDMNDTTIYSNPEVVATNINYAFEAGGWYWENKANVTATNENINIVADNDNVLRVSQCINGRVAKPHGLKQRTLYTNELKKIFNYPEQCDNKKVNGNEFGLVQLTKFGNPNIINYGVEDSYSYQKKDGTMSKIGQHGDDWIKPEKAQAFSDALNNLISEYPNQKVHLNDCSAYNPSYNLGHSANGGHSRGDGFDSKFFTVNGNGSNNIFNLSQDDILINQRFVSLLKATGQFNTFYSDQGKIPGTLHAGGHVDHLHGE